MARSQSILLQFVVLPSARTQWEREYSPLNHVNVLGIGKICGLGEVSYPEL